MNKNIKLAILLFMFAISLTILAGQVQALDFDNVKQFKEGKKFEVVIKNSFLGIPTTSVGKVNLVNYSPGCFVDDCYLYYLINNKKNLVMLKGSTTYNRLKTRELTDRTSTYQVWDNTLKSTKSNYKEICDSTYLNGSTKCRLVEKKIITTGGWVNYNVALKQNIGDYYIREKVDIRAGETIDIVPNFYGVSIDEWIDLTGYELIENHSSTANTYDYAYTTRWTAQTFTVGTTGANKDFIIQAINMTFRTGGGSIVWNVSIYGVDGANKPDMSDLLNSTQFTESLPGGYPYHSFVFPNIC